MQLQLSNAKRPEVTLNMTNLHIFNAVAALQWKENLSGPKHD
jgi:hypothetical protein